MKFEKGIILAGGTGSRLYPLTLAANKQLLPIYDKPVIYYSLTTLMLAGLKEILIISSPQDLPAIQNLLGTGEQFGIKLSYKIQEKPAGLPEAFIIGKDFINQEPVALILGDNFFHGHGLTDLIFEARRELKGAHIFTYNVEDPSRYGVVTLNEKKEILSIEEKPKNSHSKLAITGLYYFDGTVAAKAKKLKPSARRELEITDLIRAYQAEGKLSMSLLGRGYVWFDVGNPQSLLDASNYVEVIQSRQGIAIASPEEVAWRMGFIDKKQLSRLVQKIPKGHYEKTLTLLCK